VHRLLEAGARVHVVAPAVTPELEGFLSEYSSLRISRERFNPSHLDGGTLVFAATDDVDVNRVIAELARERGIAVNVASAPEQGTFVTPAVHRAGDAIVAVTAGGVPAAAARIRDRIARTIDDRYAKALSELGTLRRSLLDAGSRDRWRDASRVLVGEDFCATVESGSVSAKVNEWR
jgi:siroheme synthase-like protein